MNDQFDIFLLMGQSNMAGRGRLDEVEALQDPHIFMFREDRWITARELLHTDKPEAGVGLGMSFAIELIQAHLTPIGLVPCAVGGTPLSRWMPGADLYENAVSITKRALFKGTLKGILWHQGEADSCNAEDANGYGRRFQHMINCLCSELSATGIPVVAGELGAFLRDCSGHDYFSIVNQQLRQLEQSLPAYGCVTSNGLTGNGDNLHFNSKSLREFGCRYAKKYMNLVPSTNAMASM